MNGMLAWSYRTGRRRLWLALALVALVGGAESRAAGASGPPRIAESAALQVRALQAIKTAKTPTQSKIDSRLFLGALHLQKDRRLASLTDFRFVKAEADGRVPVDIMVTEAAGLSAVLAKVESLGGTVRASSAAYRRVSARVSLERLEDLAALPEVRKVRQAIPAMTHAVNVSQGDATHGAPEARGFFGVTGAGVKVGVISDGVDSLATLQASGDLPATVQVLPGQAGVGNEGAAMLEIVHDLAPGASLAFATANPDEATFAQNILDLAAAGCNIIVDDIIYLDESPFEDGPVAQAVNTVTAAGVLYFSSAGNEGNKTDLTSGTWEGDFLASPAADPAPLAGANLHNFGDGLNSILVEFGGGNPPLLIWAEHYDLATGSASTDFDLYDMDGALTTIFDASTDVQDGVGGDDFPIEFIGGGTFGGERLLIDKFAAGTTSSVPMLNLIVFRGELDDARTTPGATRGHSSAAAAFSVAATPAAASFDGVTPDGPYPGLFTAANASESFTSDGPRRIILSPTGAELTPGNRTSTGGVVRQKPDLTAADGVATAAPGFNPFYGTSAAAPHAAAIAALLKSAVPSLTPAEVRTALVSSAIDIEAVGADRDTGAGIVMAHAALVAAGAVPRAAVTGTKTVTGAFSAGTPVTYKVVLTNGGAGAQADNPGHELTDVLPAALSLVSAVATSGTAVATIGTSTVTWDGALAANGGSVTVTITATINLVAGGTVVSNQGSISYDGDGNGTNEASATTDDPGAGGANDSTSFIVVGGVVETATKTVAGKFGVGGAVTYTVTITNTGSAAAGDNPGNELTDVLPASLTLVGASASSGTAVATIGTNTVTWNGSIAGGASVTVTIGATVRPGTAGTTVSNQGSISYDGDGNGTNETAKTTDDPTVGGANDPTTFVVLAGSFFTVAPCRVLDTRSSTAIAAGATLTVVVTGATCGLPATATAVSVNATATLGQAPAFVTLYPGDESAPNTSTLNVSAGQTRANNAIVALAPDGSLKILNGSGGTIEVIVDITGYFE